MNKSHEEEAKVWAEKRAGHRKGIIAFSDLMDAYLAALAGPSVQALVKALETIERTLHPRFPASDIATNALRAFRGGDEGWGERS